MAGEAVDGWDMRVLAVSESALGTTPAPAAAQGFECINLDLGPSEVGRTRPKRDRNLGRGMQSAFVEGRVDPIPFSLEASVKSRALVDTTPKEDVVYAAAGMKRTTSGGVNVVYSLPADPVGSGDFKGLSLYRALGPDVYRYEAEQLRGGGVRTLSWNGGDQELTLKAQGVGIGKYHQSKVDSVTLANGAVTTVVISAEESYRLSIGYYQIESEIIQMTAVTDGGTSGTIVRGVLGSSAAAHTAVPMYPYMPTPTYAGSPISEANVTGTLDSIAMRVMSFNVSLDTGIEPGPGETGSKYFQFFKALRYDIKLTMKSVLHREEVGWLGKARARKNVALSWVCGTGAGSIVTFSLPNCEVVPVVVPTPDREVVMVDLAVRCKDSATGNDMMTVTLT